eukprot:scaffold33945_cov60-Phaeocystis_antarctica.AAC.1
MSSGGSPGVSSARGAAGCGSHSSARRMRPLTSVLRRACAALRSCRPTGSFGAMSAALTKSESADGGGTHVCDAHATRSIAAGAQEVDAAGRTSVDQRGLPKSARGAERW